MDLLVYAKMVIPNDLVVEFVNEVGIIGVLKGKYGGVIEAVSLHPESLEFLMVGVVSKGDKELFENLKFILVVEVKGFLQVDEGVSIGSIHLGVDEMDDDEGQENGPG
jgi:hypothetical protein